MRNNASKVIVCDLDNCLFDDSHRLDAIDWSRTVEQGRYDRYHALAVLDGAPCSAMLEKLAAKLDQNLGAELLFVTSRPQRFSAITRTQISASVMPRLEVLTETTLGWDVVMRPRDDHSPSGEMKVRLLSAYLASLGMNKDAVLIAYDDHPAVLDAYAAAGIPWSRHQLHDRDAYNPPAPKAQPELRAPDHLELGAKTFRERNAIYGDTYLDFGRAAVHCFPKGLHIAPGDVEGFNRLGVLVQCMSKVMRYCANVGSGGHADSSHDLMVYAAMLSEVTKEQPR